MLHLVFNDGTQNGLDDDNPTNIRIMAKLAEGFLGQKVYYFEGPGNDERNIFEHLAGSLFGADMWSIRDAAIKAVLEFYKDGDTIAVFGFSRGSAIAHMICHEFAKRGIKVIFLGCFDTVFAALPFGPSQQGLFTDLTVSGLVENARHAVSIDEDRAAFAPNLMNYRPGVVEMWFKGNHADIGGGYKERGLSDITLHWMLSEARVCASIDFKPVHTMQSPNSIHRERLPARRETRKPIVQVDGKASSLPVQFHP